MYGIGVISANIATIQRAKSSPESTPTALWTTSGMLHPIAHIEDPRVTWALSPKLSFLAQLSFKHACP